MKIKSTEKTALLHAQILDGTAEMTPVSGKVLLIEGDTIAAILSEDEWAQRADRASYEPVDLSGQYVMPGLINMHVHLAGNGKPQKKQRDNEALVRLLTGNALVRAIAYRVLRSFAQIELMSGVTTVRAVGGVQDFDTRIRDDVASGRYLGARVLAANQGISVPGGHMAGSVANKSHTVDEALRQVDAAAAQKVDLIKLMITGGVLDAKEKGVPGELKMAPEMVKAVCDKAHALGYKVAAHVESPDGVRVALQNGVDSIEHGAKPDGEIMELFRSTGAFLCTTLSPALPYALFDRSVSHASEVEQYNGNVVFQGIIDCAKAALENGIPVALGNDVGCPYITQYDFWREPLYFHQYIGVSNAFALHTATLGNATLAGIADFTGSIAVGKKAELTVTAENPLDDLHALRTPTHVFAHGKMIVAPKIRRNPVVDAELEKIRFL